MKVKCSQCSTAYSVDDAKVAGKKFGFDCPKCGTNVVIDNRQIETPAVIEAMPELPMNSFNESSIPDLPIQDEQSIHPTVDDFDNTFEHELEPEIDLSVLNQPSLDNDDVIPPDLSLGIPEEDLTSSLDAFDAKPVETDSSLDEDESVTIDLSSLDIDLAEPEEMSPSSQDIDFSSLDADADSEKITIGEDLLAEREPTPLQEEDEDEKFTLDLESLDIPLEEGDGSIHEGLPLDDSDDSRLSINDAGLSLDEVHVGASAVTPLAEDVFDEDSFHLTLDEIDNSIDIDDINRFTEPSEHQPESENNDSNNLFNDQSNLGGFASELPEVDLDQFSAAPLAAMPLAATAMLSAPPEDRFLDIENRKPDDFYDGYGEYHAEQIAQIGGGYVDFTIDYALHYSRVKAIFRFFGLYYLTFIPHFFVGLIYSLISGCVSFFNYLIIAFSGKRERDFSLLQENTLRYGVSIFAALLNVIEEKPSFAGHKNIDSQLQMNVVYPASQSRVLACLRLSGVGIFLVTLPHIILLLVLSVGMTLIAFISLIFTIFAGRWPSIMFDFMVRYLRYYTSVSAFMSGLIDTYPSFRFE